MAYLMQFKRDVPSIHGVEEKKNEDGSLTRFYKKGKIYPIQPNNAVHFYNEGFADFSPNPNPKRKQL